MDCSGEGSFSTRGIEVDKVEDGIACVPLGRDIGPPMEALSPLVSVLCRRGGGGIDLRGGVGGKLSSAISTFLRTSELLSIMIKIISSVKLFVGRTIFTLTAWN